MIEFSILRYASRYVVKVLVFLLLPLFYFFFFHASLLQWLASWNLFFTKYLKLKNLILFVDFLLHILKVKFFIVPVKDIPSRFDPAI